MPVKILKSRITSIPDFAAEVVRAAAERTAWREHMANVGKDPNKFTPYPQPQPHPEVARAIAEVQGVDGASETYVPDYEIEDDSPPPEVLLRQRKDVLITIVSRLEAHATEQVSLPGKRRFWHMREVDIRNADTVRGNAILGEYDEKRQERVRNMTAKKREDPDALAKAMDLGITDDEITAEVAKGRAPGDTDFLAEQEARAAKLEAIARHGAKLHHDIEDLASDAEIDKFEIPPFPI